MDRLFAFWLILLSISVVGLEHMAAQDSSSNVFSPQDFSVALSEAQSREVPLYLLYTSPTICPPCRYFEKYVLSDREVASYLNEHFVTASITPSDPDFDSIKIEYRLSGLPTHVIVNPDGSLRHVFIGGATPQNTDSIIREYRDRLTRALSETQNLGYLIAMREARRLSTDELRDFAYAAKDATATYPEDVYSRRIVRGSGPIGEEYLARLSQRELLSDSGRDAIRNLAFRVDASVTQTILMNAETWVGELGRVEVADILLTILENDVRSRFHEKPADSATLALVVTTIVAMDEKLRGEEEQDDEVRNRLCSALAIADRTDLCP